MLALKIIGGVLLVLLLLLLAPVRVSFRSWNGETTASVRYLLFRFQLLPWKERKKKPRKPKKEKPKKKSKVKEAPKEPKKPPAKKPNKKVEQLRRLLKSSRKAVALLCRHLVIYQVKAELQIGKGDAHQTALAYAKAASFLAILLELLGELFVLRKPDIRMEPAFHRETSQYNLALKVRLRPIFPLAAGVILLTGMLKGSRTSGKGPQSKE